MRLFYFISIGFSVFQYISIFILLSVSSTGFSQTTISNARSQVLGSTVSVSGIVTVANEFGGPSYIQDQTGGLAVFYTSFHTAVSIGDSVTISGPMVEYGQTSTAGTGILEISGTGITYQIFKKPNTIIKPKTVSISEIGEDLEGQLLEIKNVTVSGSGSFKGNTNYSISDASGFLSQGLRIDKDVTDAVGLTIPSEPISITGVLGQYLGSYQILPRSATDLSIIPKKKPYEDLSADSTLDIVTWNCEWLGYGGSQYGPSDDVLQIQHVAKVIKTLNADVYGIQEMSSTDAFQTLLDSLPGFDGMYAPFTQTQKTAFIYKKSTVKPVSADFLFTSGDWASGRYPYEFIFDYVQNGKSNRVNAVNIHAKATTTSPQNDYQRRVTDMSQLKPFFDTNRSTEKLILLGDYNDDLDVSVVSSQPSPYVEFVTDSDRYNPISKFFSDNKIGTHSGGSTLDHMIISNELSEAYLDSTIQLGNVNFISGYLSTTSDHYPVKARFKFKDGVSVGVTNSGLLGSDFTLLGNYPNPFNPSTSFRFQLPENGNVTIDIYALNGQKIATVFSNYLTNGIHEVSFNAASLSSGIYFYKIQFSNEFRTGKFTLIK